MYSCMLQRFINICKSVCMTGVRAAKAELCRDRRQRNISGGQPQLSCTAQLTIYVSGYQNTGKDSIGKLLAPANSETTLSR